MEHRCSEPSKTRLRVLGLPPFVIAIALPLLAAAALAQSYPATPTAPAPKTYQPSQRHVAKGAGRGAAVGAVGGAITGDPGKGAAAGAAMGATAGALRRRDQRKSQQYAQ